jgi:hypothetical protein
MQQASVETSSTISQQKRDYQAFSVTSKALARMPRDRSFTSESIKSSLWTLPSLVRTTLETTTLRQE